ncbi:hypothetical protein ACOME3_006831 [Neoechinorhynchus agilis]
MVSSKKKQSMPDYIPVEPLSEGIKEPKRDSQSLDTGDASKPVVVYFGHLPEGLFESQLYSYCSQFGSIRRLKMPRSKRTHRVRGYAFVEFDRLDVARVVVEAMNGYVMFERMLVCKIREMDDEERNRLFKCWDQFKRPKRARLMRWIHNRSKSPSKIEKYTQRRKKNIRRKMEQMKTLGINLKVTENGSVGCEEPKN